MVSEFGLFHLFPGVIFLCLGNNDTKKRNNISKPSKVLEIQGLTFYNRLVNFFSCSVTFKTCK